MLNKSDIKSLVDLESRNVLNRSSVDGMSDAFDVITPMYYREAFSQCVNMNEEQIRTSMEKVESDLVNFVILKMDDIFQFLRLQIQFKAYQQVLEEKD